MGVFASCGHTVEWDSERQGFGCAMWWKDHSWGNAIAYGTVCPDCYKCRLEEGWGFESEQDAKAWLAEFGYDDRDRS